MPESLLTRDELDLYENGKNRRYSLLFAVNGGAFAIAKLMDGSGRELGGLTIGMLAAGMVVFTMIMTLDIFSFGFWCRHRFREPVFGPIGWTVLGSIGMLICAGWLLVGFKRYGDEYLTVISILLFIGVVTPALAAAINYYYEKEYDDKPAADGTADAGPEA